MKTNEIKIIGVGLAGHNVLERIPFETIENTDYILCDVSAENLAKSSIEDQILLGTGIVKHSSMEDKITIGMETILNSEVDLATNLAIDGFDQFDSLFGEASKMAILINYLSDTIGAGVTPVIAQIAKKRGMFVAAIVYTPFDFENKITKEIANKSLKKLRADCDFVLVIEYAKIGKLYGKLGIKNSFGKADDIVIRLAKTVTQMVSVTNDLLDLKLFFENNQNDTPFFIGIGDGNGVNRAKDAIELALKNTLSERDTLKGVSNVFLQINYGSIELTIDERLEIKNIILNAKKNKSGITMSVSEDISLDNSLSVLVIAF
jgi:cell division protein FtsZ